MTTIQWLLAAIGLLAGLLVWSWCWTVKNFNRLIDEEADLIANNIMLRTHLRQAQRPLHIWMSYGDPIQFFEFIQENGSPFSRN